MSLVRVGMTLLLLGAVASCGTSATGSGPAPSSAAASVTMSRSGGASRTQSVAPRPSSNNATPPPYIGRVVWVRLPSGASLQVHPTPHGRVAQGEDAEQEAWREVLRKAPDAGSPGMRAQFDCHWVFARLARPNKPSWNLEPWRPVVSAQRMYDAGCNPGGPES